MKKLITSALVAALLIASSANAGVKEYLKNVQDINVAVNSLNLDTKDLLSEKVSRARELNNVEVRLVKGVNQETQEELLFVATRESDLSGDWLILLNEGSGLNLAVDLEAIDFQYTFDGENLYAMVIKNSRLTVVQEVDDKDLKNRLKEYF